MKYLKELIAFVQNVANDPRIPPTDKKILLVLVALIISPFDLIPDWIPIIGIMDDLVLMGIVLDYFFNHLDREILLSHYPWSMKSFVRLQKTAQVISFIAPKWVKDKVWKFKPNIYEN
jgi:uncharacterized membrane protein YkvA (DUF1232 family)